MSAVSQVLLHRLLPLALLAIALASPATALKPIAVTGEQERIEITTLGDAYEGRGDSLQLETAPGPDGSTGRMGVRATTRGTNPNWLAFALNNPTDKTIELWLIAERYTVVGSGIVWPDLDAKRIEAVSHSAGFAPERIRSDRADIFRLTIERGQTITYVAELSSERFSRLYLWKPIEFEQRQRDRQLFNGIMLGITGLLAVFLTAVFAANHKAIFPSAALVSWCVLALLCVDFGFWHKLFQMRPEDNAQYRAASEAALAASLVVFLFAFLRVNLWNGFARTLFVVWIAGQLAIVATAVLDPRLAATVARMSLALIGGIGALTVLALALRGLDRALALAPTWILFLVWLFGAGVTLTGRLSGEFAISGLVAGLVLIIVLIGFTVTQFAFKSGEPIYGSSPGQQQLRVAAIEGAGASVWEWSARRGEIKLDANIEAALGLNPGELPTKVAEFAALLHPADKERFLVSLESIKERGGGVLRIDLRLRHADDSSYRWFELEGASVPGTDRRQLRCVGLVRDVTDDKRAQERLMHNSVHDSLTGLPNRELFLDRLNVTMRQARNNPAVRPAVLFFDIDKFKSVNSAFGLIVGDSILLTVSRRLARTIEPTDTLARLGGDQFALLVASKPDSQQLAAVADRLRQALRTAIRIAGQEIVLTGAIGIALYDGTQQDGRDLMREAEIAMFRAKRGGSDRIEIFTPQLRTEKDQRIAIESELRRAIETRQLRLLYQPIVSLSSEELVGFEALVRWAHPKLGLLSPADFIPVAEESDLIVQLGSFVLSQAADDIARWQKELPRPHQPLFVSVNVSSRQLIKPDLVNEIRHTLGRAVISGDTLRLEITESLVMENPEQASHVLELLKETGVHLSLDDFGTGYSSLAYLNRFPFDTIKIDKALVEASGDGDKGAIIVRSIVVLGHELGKKIVAEGVETAEDAAFLRSIGCQYAQGFHYGEPMSEADVSRLLKLIRKADRRMRRRGLVRGSEKRKAIEGPQTPAEADPGPTLELPSAAGSPQATPAGRPAPGPRAAMPPPVPPDRVPPTAPASRPRTAGPASGPAPASPRTGPPAHPAATSPSAAVPSARPPRGPAPLAAAPPPQPAMRSGQAPPPAAPRTEPPGTAAKGPPPIAQRGPSAVAGGPAPLRPTPPQLPPQPSVTPPPVNEGLSSLQPRPLPPALSPGPPLPLPPAALAPPRPDAAGQPIATIDRALAGSGGEASPAAQAQETIPEQPVPTAAGAGRRSSARKGSVRSTSPDALPPGIAERLAKLAGKQSAPPRPAAPADPAGAEATDKSAAE